MARPLPFLSATLVAEIEQAWLQTHPRWAWRRLLVVRLLAQRRMTVAEIMQTADVSRQTVFTYRDLAVAGGVAALLRRGKAPGSRSIVHGEVEAELIRIVARGQLRHAKNARAWIKRRTGQTLTEGAVRKVLARARAKVRDAQAA